MKIPYYRDWYVLEHYDFDIFNILKIDFYDQLLWNVLPLKNNFSYYYILIYSLCWFVFPFILTLWMLRINKQLRLLPFVLFYFVSYWLIERVLMGQVNLIRGYWLFLPLILIIIFKYNSYLFQILLAIVNIHFSIFGIIFEFLFGKKINVVIPILIHLVNLIFRKDLYNSIDSNIYLNFKSITNIINPNIIINTIMGTASWASNTFIELQELKYLFNPYFNFYLSFLVFVLFIYIWLEQNIKLKITSLIVLALTASIIPIIYNFPLSNIYREGSKFYPLFLILILIHFLNQKQSLRFINYIYLILSVMNIVLIVLLIPKLNMIEYDKAEISKVNSVCKDNKVELVPNDLYLTTSQSNNIFAANIFDKLFDCNFGSPLGTTLKYSVIGEVQYTCSDKYQYHLLTIPFYQSKYYDLSNCSNNIVIKTNNFVIVKQ
jgi:hypothetical protein